MCDIPNMPWRELEAKLGKILSEKSKLILSNFFYNDFLITTMYDITPIEVQIAEIIFAVSDR